MSSVEVLEPEGTASSLDDEALFEILDGKRMELPPMGAHAVRVAFKLGAKIEMHAETRDLGVAITESLFVLRSKPNLQRRPDAAFVSFDRWPKGRTIPFGNAWDVVPDLVVEVVSPTNLAEEIPTRVREYFEAGVRRAWVIYVHESLVYEYDSTRSIRVLTREDVLDGGEVIPGFRLPLSELFAGAQGPEAA